MNIFYHPIVWVPLLLFGFVIFVSLIMSIPIYHEGEGWKPYLRLLFPVLLLLAGLCSFDGFNDLQIEEKCSQKCINLINNKNETN